MEKIDPVPASISSQITETVYLNQIDESQYKSYYPIDLIFETIHSDNPEQYFIVTTLNPSFHSSTSYSYSDPLNPVHRNGLHQHAYFELIYVIDGSMYQNIENKRHLYSNGSLCLLNRNIHHAEEFTTDFRAAFLSLPVALVDELFNQVKSELITAIAEESDQGEICIDMVMVAKYFERIADHVVNIAEWVEYSVTGEHKSHE